MPNRDQNRDRMWRQNTKESQACLARLMFAHESPRGVAVRSEDVESWGPQDPRNRYRQLHYVQGLVRRQDLPRLRELVYRWQMSRLDVITRLLDLARDGSRTRTVSLPPAVWARLDDQAVALDSQPDELVSRWLELASQVSPAQTVSLLAAG